MKRPRHVLLMLGPAEKSRADHVVFAFLFLVGAALGFLCGGLLNESQQRELGDYVLGYAHASSASRSASVLDVILAYFRAPVAFFLLGLAACGTWLIPLLMVGQGFLLAYSVRCFGVALGRSGVLLASAAFGIRCLFVLPCVFYLAARSRTGALRLRAGNSLREKPDGVRGFYPVFICCIALLIGCVVEISLVPRLIALILI